MVDEEHTGAVLVAHRAHDLGERRDLRLGQSGRGLVEQHEARLGRERAGDTEPPLVAVGERRGGGARVVGETKRGQE